MAVKKDILLSDRDDAEINSFVKLCEASFNAESDVVAMLTPPVLYDLTDHVLDIERDNRNGKSYRDVRICALQKLVLLLGDNNITEPICTICNAVSGERSERRLISNVRAMLENARGEKLVVVFYTDQGSLCSVYESESWEVFGCDADNERLKRYRRNNAPSSMIMIHSHPGRTLAVSEDDVRFTESIEKYAKKHGSVLTEHFVIPSIGEDDDYIGIIAEARGRTGSDRFN